MSFKCFEAYSTFNLMILSKYAHLVTARTTLQVIKKGNSICLAHRTISIFHGCMVWIEKSVTRVTDRHHEACRVMPNSDLE